jgi:hypothetical protein
MYNAAVIDYKTLITQSIPETQLAPRDRSELIGLRYLTASGLLSRVIQGLKVTLVLPLNLSEDTSKYELVIQFLRSFRQNYIRTFSTNLSSVSICRHRYFCPIGKLRSSVAPVRGNCITVTSIHIVSVS